MEESRYNKDQIKLVIVVFLLNLKLKKNVYLIFLFVLNRRIIYINILTFL